MSEHRDNVKPDRDGPCYICGERTIATAANPSKWPTFYPYPGGNGKWRRYCTKCVIDKLNADPPVCTTVSAAPAAPSQPPVSRSVNNDPSEDVGLVGNSAAPVHPKESGEPLRALIEKWRKRTDEDEEMNGMFHQLGDRIHDERKKLAAELESVAQTAVRIPRCQATHPEGGQCELRDGHAFDKHLAGMILWGRALAHPQEDGK